MLHPAYPFSNDPITTKVLKAEQEKYLKGLGKIDKEMVKGDDGVYRRDSKIIVPPSLFHSILYFNHIRMNHGSIETQLLELKVFSFTCSSDVLESSLKALKRLCMHCDGPSKLIRRPLGSIPHSDRPGGIIYTDFLSIYNGYILVLVDDFTRKVLLQYAETCRVESVVDALVIWHSQNTLLTPFTLCSDNGSHFANRVMQGLAAKLPFQHHFSIAYAPWSNGSAEVTNRLIISQFRVLMSQYALEKSDWPSLLPVITAYINNRPVKDFLGLSPNQLWSGRSPQGLPIIDESDPKIKDNLQEDKAFPILKNGLARYPTNESEVAAAMSKLCDELRSVDKTVYALLEKRRDSKRLLYNSKIKLQDISFAPGDAVKVSTIVGQFGDKLKLQWNGPYFIKSIVGEHLYEVEDLLGKVSSIHACRIVLYDKHDFPREEVIKEVFLFNSGKFEVDKFVGVRAYGDEYELQVSWIGFESAHDSWEPFKTMFEDVPGLVIEFLEKARATSDVAMYLYNLYVVQELAFIILEYPDELQLKSDGIPEFLSHSRGWTGREREILQRAIEAYGIGNWKEIMDGKHLIGKTKSQLVMEVQRLAGCQRLSDFAGLKCSLKAIKEYNDSIPGKRRNGVLIQYNERTPEEKKKQHEDMLAKFSPVEIKRDPSEVGMIDLENISNERLTLEQKAILYDQLLEKSNMCVDGSVNEHLNEKSEANVIEFDMYEEVDSEKEIDEVVNFMEMIFPKEGIDHKWQDMFNSFRYYLTPGPMQDLPESHETFREHLAYRTLGQVLPLGNLADHGIINGKQLPINPISSGRVKTATGAEARILGYVRRSTFISNTSGCIMTLRNVRIYLVNEPNWKYSSLDATF